LWDQARWIEQKTWKIANIFIHAILIKIVEERRLIELNRRIDEENLQKKIKAALTIQSFWRAFKVRRGLFKKKGKRGKGKGKGKGRGKGKSSK
jgi:hypothetical protein